MKMEEDDSFIRMFMDDETAERVVRGFQTFLGRRDINITYVLYMPLYFIYLV